MAPLDVLPPALVRDNNATAPLACFAGGRWDPAEAAQGQGFALRASGADAGFAAESAGATLKVKLGASVGKFIGVSYVRAPKGMGKALVTCGGTCDCGSHDLEGHVDGDKAVVTHAKLKVKGEKGGGTDCVVEITAETARSRACLLACVCLRSPCLLCAPVGCSADAACFPPGMTPPAELAVNGRGCVQGGWGGCWADDAGRGKGEPGCCNEPPHLLRSLAQHLTLTPKLLSC